MGDDVGIPVQGWFVVKSVCVAADLNLGTDTRWIGQCHYNNYDVNNSLRLVVKLKLYVADTFNKSLYNVRVFRGINRSCIQLIGKHQKWSLIL